MKTNAKLALAVAVIAVACIGFGIFTRRSVVLPSDAKKFLDARLQKFVLRKKDARLTRYSFQQGFAMILTQWKNPELRFEYFGTQGNPLSESDKLNGISERWVGNWSKVPSRSIVIPFGGQQSEWGEWGEKSEVNVYATEKRTVHLPTVILIRKRGQFEIRYETVEEAGVVMLQFTVQEIQEWGE